MKVYLSNELYHHGILGMHWGIRRYQPYGQGYSPKSKGREVGEAAKVEGRADRIEKRAQKYRDKETKKVTKYYDKEIAKQEKKAIKAFNKMQELDPNSNRFRNNFYKMNVSDDKALNLITAKQKELKAIKNLTPKDIKKEKRAVAANIVVAALADVGSVALGATLHAPVIPLFYTNARAIKSNRRLKADN